MAVDRNQLLADCEHILSPQSYKDYCPNGLQVEGGATVSRIASAVTASYEVIQRCAKLEAQLLLVHHGLFWRGDSPSLTGWLYRRVQALIVNKINLVAYHLPLDDHELVGNNTQLAKRLGFLVEGRLSHGGQVLGCYGAPVEAMDLDFLLARCQKVLGQEPLVIHPCKGKVKRLAWCTGSAASFLPAAKAKGAQVFITGEINEASVHIARELDITLIAAGHHATERYGVQALAEHLAGKYAIAHHYIEIDNPV